MLSALKWGGIVGAGAYLVARLGLGLLSSAIFGAGSPVDLNHPGPFSLACLGIFALLFAFSAAGYFTGRESRKAGLGAVAGMIAFAVYAAFSAIPLGGLTGSPATSSAPTTPGAPQQSPVTQAIVSLVALCFALAVAALMGWLGGRPGAMNARRRQAAEKAREAQ